MKISMELIDEMRRRTNCSYQEAKELLAKRAATEKIRYKDIYNLNYMDFNNYNLVIDSTFCSPDLIARIIYNEAKEYYRDNEAYGMTKLYLPPARLIDTGAVSREESQRLQALIEEYKKVDYKIDDIITARKADEDYEALDNIDKVKAAYLAGVPYIQAVLVKQH